MEYSTNRLGAQDPAGVFVCQILNPAEVEEWSANLSRLSPKAKERHWCAMCCVRSLLLAEQLPAPSVEDLFDEACRFGVYREDPAVGWRGAYHRELAQFVASKHPRYASAYRSMSVHNNVGGFGIGQLIGFGHYVILSVHQDIRLHSSEPPSNKRGHFVFVYGYKVVHGQGYFLLNNPAGYASHGSQVGMEVSAERLSQLSCGDGVVVASRFVRPRGE